MTIYLAADASDEATRSLLPNVGVLTQSVAERMRALLGAQPGQLPHGEPTITWQGVLDWRDALAGLEVTAYRDGRLTWADISPASASPALKLIARALDATHAAGGPWFLWPDSTVDLLVFRMRLHMPSIDGTGHTHLVLITSADSAAQSHPVPVQNAIPVFSIAQPQLEHARVLRQPYVHYPLPVDSLRAEATVIMQFVVDTSGRVDKETIKDLWPADQPRLTGELGRYYQSFVRAVRDGLNNARFQPARVGGCPVRQLVHMPFQFKLRR